MPCSVHIRHHQRSFVTTNSCTDLYSVLEAAAATFRLAFGWLLLPSCPFRGRSPFHVSFSLPTTTTVAIQWPLALTNHGSPGHRLDYMISQIFCDCGSHASVVRPALCGHGAPPDGRDQGNGPLEVPQPRSWRVRAAGRAPWPWCRPGRPSSVCPRGGVGARGAADSQRVHWPALWSHPAQPGGLSRMLRGGSFSAHDAQRPRWRGGIPKRPR